MTNNEKYNLSRAKAAKLLGVSVRTVDRYIAGKKLSIERIDGRIWLSEHEVLAFNKGSGVVDSSGGNSKDRVDKHMHGSRQYVDTVHDSVDVVNIDTVDIMSRHDKGKERPTTNFYEKLYHSTKKELNQKQERLEIANYRVGQLEAQIKNSISMLEYHQQNSEEFQKMKLLAANITENKDKFDALKREVRYERLNKKILAIVLLFLLALQPIWILLVYKS
jgi:hypothetical protein